MADDNEGFPIGDEAVPPEPEFRGFTHDQMVTCAVCLRANAPTRTSCLYCAAALPATEATALLRRPTLRRLEKWERGFNCILMPEKTAAIDDDALREMAELLRLSANDLKRIMEAGMPLPLARAATRDEAALVESKLAARGIRVLVVSDQDLSLEESPQKRIRALEFTEDSIIAHPAGGGPALCAHWAEILLFVTGRHLVRRVEIEERRGRRAENEIAHARELSSDESMLDVYTGSSEGGWRIASGSFDFSCLGDRKGLLVAENFLSLDEMLRRRASQADTDDSYNRVRHALTPAWPLEQHTESRGLRREGPGKYNVESATTSDNETQFTRYSRLRHYLKLREAGLKT
ncbi:MAG TPA: hypothetical protein VF708_00835 [Pyrinomonadaceae bacterium]